MSDACGLIWFDICITLDVSNELCQPCKSDFYFVISLPLPQVPTEAGLLYRCASCMNWFTPPVAWATRPCLCATCPSCCRPCWISCLIKVSSQKTVRRKLEIKQNTLMFHCRIENLCGAFQLHALPLKKKSRRSQPVPWWLQRYTTSFNSMQYTKPAFSWRKCNIVLWPEILRQQPGDEAVQARLFTGHTKEASVIPGWLLWELMVGGRIREMRWEQDEADSQYKILAKGLLQLCLGCCWDKPS